MSNETVIQDAVETLIVLLTNFPKERRESVCPIYCFLI